MTVRYSALIASLSVIAFAGCEWMSNDRPPPPDRDLYTDPDIWIRPEVDATDVVEEVPVEECEVNLGDWEPFDQRAGIDDYGGSAWKMEGTTVDGGFYSSPLSQVNIESWYAQGGPREAGTYVINGFINAVTCGTCVYYFENCSDPQLTSSCERTYTATEAVIDLDILDPVIGGNIKGTLSGVYMVQVHFGSGQRIEDGANFCLDYWEFMSHFEGISSWGYE